MTDNQDATLRSEHRDHPSSSEADADGLCAYCLRDSNASLRFKLSEQAEKLREANDQMWLLKKTIEHKNPNALDNLAKALGSPEAEETRFWADQAEVAEAKLSESQAQCAAMRQWVEKVQNFPHPSNCDDIHEACNNALDSNAGKSLLQELEDLRARCETLTKRLAKYEPV